MGRCFGEEVTQGLVLVTGMGRHRGFQGKENIDVRSEVKYRPWVRNGLRGSFGLDLGCIKRPRVK